MNTKDISDLLKKEELNKELVPYVQDLGSMMALRHPLIYCMFYQAQLNAMLNASYAAKKEAVDRAFNNEDWGHYIFLHERPYRWEAFQNIEHLIDEEKEFWELFRSVWIDSENMWQCHDVVNDLISTRENSHLIMDEEEKEQLSKMAECITIYRGCTSKNKNGFSWTTSKKTANWFATRLNDRGHVLTGKIQKQKVIAFIDGRGESEIIAYANDIEIVHCSSLTKKRK
jgi:hypothetical protein